MGAAPAVGKGDNTVVGGTANDFFLLGSGNNVVVMGPGDATVAGGLGLWQAPTTDAGWAVTAGEMTGFSVRSTGFDAPASYHGNTVHDLSTGKIDPVGLGNATIYGGAGNNTMRLSNGNNYVDAGDGNDVIGAGAGKSIILAGNGNDTIYGGGGTNYIDGERGDDLIVARGGHNSIFGGSGNDTIFAGEQSDWADSDPGGGNYIEGGDGNNVIYGSSGQDTLVAGTGNDTIYAGNGDQYVLAESGNAIIYGGAGHDTLVGGSGQDTLIAGKGDTTIYGGSGNALIYGGDGNDSLVAGSGNDTIVAGKGHTTIYGGSGSTLIYGGDGDTVIYAGSGGTNANPTSIVVGEGDTTIYGGSGTNHIVAGSGSNVIYAGNGGTQDAATVVQAGSGDTKIVSGTGYDQLISGGHTTFDLSAGGDATLLGITSSDVVEFDSGIDPSQLTLSAQLYADGTSSLIIDESNGGRATVVNGLTATNQYRFTDAVLNLAQLMKQSTVVAQNFTGPGFGLMLSGAPGTQLVGTTGNDTILCFGANDTLVGGAGTSLLVGGGGNTTYVASTSGHATVQGSTATDALRFADDVHAWDLVASAAPGADGKLTVTIQLPSGGLVVVQANDVGMLSQVLFSDGSKTTLTDLLAQSNGGTGMTINSDGSTTAINKAADGNIVLTHYDSKGVKIGDAWWKSDGSHGSDTFHADGSSSGTTINVDGSHIDYTNDGQGNTQTISYDAQGTKVGDSWAKADGSYGSDVFSSNGASSGIVHHADGSYATYTNDGHGNEQTISYDANGIKIGETGTDNSSGNGTSMDDGHGKVITVFTDTQGNKLSDRWNKTDGSYGSDYFNADGSSSGVAYRADGSYSTYTDDGLGQIATQHYSWSGTSLGSSVTKMDGNHNLITSNLSPTGAKLSETWIRSDGLSGSDYVGKVDYSNGLNMYGAVSIAVMYGGTGASALNSKFIKSYWSTPQPDTTETPYWADAYNNVKFDSGGLYITTDNNIYRSGAADSEIYYEVYADASINSNSVGIDFIDHLHHVEFDLAEYPDGSLKVSGFSMADFGSTGGHGTIATTNEKIPMAATLHGTNGTYANLKLDGLGNAAMMIYDAQGNKLEDMWLHNDGSRGYDIFNGDGSSSGLSSHADGTVATYTNNGHGQITSAQTLQVPEQITLPATTVGPALPPGSALTPPAGGTYAYSVIGGGLITTAFYPDGSVIIAPKSGYATTLLEEFMIMTDPGYSASLVINGKKMGWNYTEAGVPLSSYTDDGAGKVITYAYDSQGRTTQSTIATTDANGNVAGQIYDVHGNLIGSSSSVKTGPGQTKITTFDATGKITGSSIQATDGNGNSIESKYAAGGNLLSMQTVVVTSPNAATITFYDGQKNPTGVILTSTDSNGRIQTHNYDAQGQYIGSVIATPDTTGNYATANYDAAGKLTSYVLAAKDGQDNLTFHTFDRDGRLLNASTLETSGVETYTTYDQDGSSVCTTRHADHSYSIATDDGYANRVTSFYSAQDLKLNDAWTRADGSQGTDTFNADGSASGNASYADGTVESYTRNAQGRVVTNHYGADQKTLVGSTITETIQGKTLTANYDASGAKLNDHWVDGNGAVGSDVFSVDGSSSGTATNADGSYSSYADDGKGDITTTFFNKDGVKLSVTWQKADGSHGTDIFSGANQTPIVSKPINDWATDEAKPFSFAIPTGTFTDPDAGNALAYSMSLADGKPLPPWLTFDSTTGTLSGLPTGTDTGLLTLKLTATDQGGLSASTLFNLTVNNVNAAPVPGNPIATQAADELKPFSFAIPAGTFTDPGAGDTLTYSVTTADGAPLPPWLTFDTTTRTLSGTPDDADVGTLTLKVTAVDAGGLSANSDFSVVVNAVDTIWTDVSYVLPAHVHNLVGTGNANLTLTGNSLNNTITANSGNDTLVAGSGLATLVGGVGDDTFVVNNTNDVIIEQPNDGNNAVLTSVSYVTPANVQNITGTGTADLTLTGNGLNNVITANSGNDILIGGNGDSTFVAGVGNSTIYGGTGNDTYSYHQGDGLSTVADKGGNNKATFGDGLSLQNVTIRLTRTDGKPYVVAANASNQYNLTQNGMQVSGVATLNAHLRILGVHGVEQPTTGMDFAVSIDSNGNITSPIQRFQFADGSTKTFNEMLVKSDVIDASLVSGPVTTGRNDDLVFAGAKNTVIQLGSGSDTVYASYAGNAIYGGGGNDYLIGSWGNDTLVGGWGVSVLEGGGGTDVLKDVNGPAAIYGGYGSSTITTAVGNDFIAVGMGSTTITTGATYNVIALNGGGGQVTLNPSPGASNTLSIGGGLGIKDLFFAKTGNDLKLTTTWGDQMRFRDWYTSAANRDFVTLQIIEEASSDYDASSPDPLRNQRFEQYDFGKLVVAFDHAYSANPSLNKWSLANNMLDAHLSGSNTAALGGDLAYAFSNPRVDPGQSRLVEAVVTLSDPQFGRVAQTVSKPLV